MQKQFNIQIVLRLLALASILVGGLAVGLFGTTRPARAASWVVNTLTDAANGNCASTCTLRDALSLAASGDTIQFQSGLTGTITLGSAGTLTIATNLTINGPSAAGLTISGNNANRILSVSAGATVSISNLTFIAGNVPASSGYVFGGAVQNDGVLTISDCTFSGNVAYWGGGAIFNEGNVTVSNSTFSGNTVSFGQEDGNHPYTGGGAILDIYGHGMTISNSTFSNNSVPGSLGKGGAIANEGGTFLTIGSSIIAGNTATNAPNILQGATTVTSLGHNLIGDATNSSGWGATDQINVANAMLDPLGSYGGPTQTIRLQPGSPAIGEGDCNLPSPAMPVTTDQRGVARKTPCDVGAYETAPLPTATPTPTSTPCPGVCPTNTPTSTPTNTPTITPTSTPVLGRLDTIGVFRSGTFLLRLHNTAGVADISVAFNPGNEPYPLVGDWTGAGFDTVGALDRSNGLFTLCTANDTAACAQPANQISFVFGNPNDEPFSGRWLPGMNTSGVGLFRPNIGLIFLRNALSTGVADYTMVMGIPGDVGLVGDWNSDGLDSPGVYRPTNSVFYLTDQVCNCSVTGSYQFTYGFGGDVPVTGDWSGQGHDGVGLFRYSNGYTYLRNTLTTGYADNAFTYGIAGDVPVAGHWQLTYPPKPNLGSVLVPPTLVPQPGHPTSGGNNNSSLGD